MTEFQIEKNAENSERKKLVSKSKNRKSRRIYRKNSSSSDLRAENGRKKSHNKLFSDADSKNLSCIDMQIQEWINFYKLYRGTEN